MPLHPRAGQSPTPDDLVNVPRLITAYYAEHPDASQAPQRVSFGTSGHRGSAFDAAFNEDHILAITQAICEYRGQNGADGPLFLAADTHALSEPAFTSALEVLAANDVDVMIDQDRGYTPTPALSHAILTYNRPPGSAARTAGLADGIVITPSHNPPDDGGFKYNPPHGGPADTVATQWIEDRANRILRDGLRDVRRRGFAAALAALHHPSPRLHFGLRQRPRVGGGSRCRARRRSSLGADPLGGAGVAYWGRIAERYGLKMDIAHADPRPHLPLHAPGLGRQDPHGLLFALRHGGPDRAEGQLRRGLRLRHRPRPPWHRNPQRRLAESQSLSGSGHLVSVHAPRRLERQSAGVGKTMVSSSLIDRVVASLGRPLVEVPVGFKWFVDGLLAGSLGFGGEESAGASFLRRDGTVWTTDKDGIIMALLAAEILARTGKDPGQIYDTLDGAVRRPGVPAHRRSGHARAESTPGDAFARSGA